MDRISNTALHTLLPCCISYLWSSLMIIKPNYQSTLKNIEDALCPTTANIQARFIPYVEINNHTHLISMKKCFHLYKWSIFVCIKNCFKINFLWFFVSKYLTCIPILATHIPKLVENHFEENEIVSRKRCEKFCCQSCYLAHHCAIVLVFPLWTFNPHILLSSHRSFTRLVTH